MLVKVETNNEKETKEIITKIKEIKGVQFLQTCSVTHKTREGDKLPSF